MRQVGSFLRVLKVSSTTKTDLHYIAEILLNTVTLKMHSNFYLSRLKTSEFPCLILRLMEIRKYYTEINGNSKA
jgi:hypothetical protein